MPVFVFVFVFVLWKNIFLVLETASDVLAPGFGASSVSGVGDDTATNPGKGEKIGLGRKDDHYWCEITEKLFRKYETKAYNGGTRNNLGPALPVFVLPRSPPLPRSSLPLNIV